MLTKEENEELTQVGPGTPGGELLRRYWHPVCAAAELTPDRPKKRVRLLTENLVVYRDPEGGYGCVGEQCSHRGVSLYYGFLEDGGIRCPYHGWLYDAHGKCLQQPFEPPESMMRHAIRHPAYPVEERAGLLFLYLGPEPAPLVPNWDVIARKDGARRIEFDPVLNCNWLQMMETNVDPTHNHFLHHYTAIKMGLGWRGDFSIPILQVEFELGEFGVLKRCQLGGKPPRGDRWEEGGCAVFPNILRHSLTGGRIDLHYRVPIDDTHSQTVWLGFDASEDGREVEQSEIPITYNVLKDDNGDFLMDNNGSQDSMAWETQGPIRDRTIEHLGAGDRGVVLFRQVLKEQIEVVRNGDDPIGVIRDRQRNHLIRFASNKERLAEAAPPRSVVRQVLSGQA